MKKFFLLNCRLLKSHLKVICFFIICFLLLTGCVTEKRPNIRKTRNHDDFKLDFFYCTAGEIALVYKFQFDNKGKVTMKTLVEKHRGHRYRTLAVGYLKESDLQLIQTIMNDPEFRRACNDLSLQGAKVLEDSPYIYIEFNDIHFYILLKKAPSETRNFLTTLDSILLNCLGKTYSENVCLTCFFER